MKTLMIKKSVVFLLLFASSMARSQFSIGTWRDHLPYSDCIDLCQVGDIIYVATPYSVFTYHPIQNEINRISKATLLTDVGITAIEYDPISNYVVVGYENGNLDLIQGETVFNIPDIKFSTIIGDKTIYDILPYQDRVYLSTGFGVVVLNMNRLEVKETYFIGPNGGPVRVNDAAIFENKLYAATETGLQTADLNNTFLANFQNWSLVSDLPADSTVQHIEFFNNHMLVSIPQVDKDILWKKNMAGGNWEVQSSLSDYRINQLWSNEEWFTVSGSYAFLVNHLDFGFTNNVSLLAGRLLHTKNCIIGNYGHIWAADKFSGLMWRQEFDGSKDALIKPEGPQTANCRRIGAYNNNVWIAHGGVKQDWGSLWNSDGMSGLVDGHWVHFEADTFHYSGNHFNTHNGLVSDFMDVAVDPIDNSRIMAGSWDEGLIEMNTSTMMLQPRNGTAQNGPDVSEASTAEGWVGVASVDFDDTGILWCTNSYTSNAVHAYDRNGAFFDFNFAPSIGEDDIVGDLMVSENGLIWATVRNKGLLVLNYNGTLSTFSDDDYKVLTDAEGNGKLPSNDVNCMEEDLDGEVWVGTAEGLSIFYNPDAIFTSDSYDSEQILIEQDGNIQILLETEIINAIEIDGSNRKWIATQNSGVYLFSDDGLQQVYHFTKENSPLLSNTVYDIAINHENGEVFFATEKGVIGYFSTATNFDAELSNVRVFPNPVRPEYDGNITIDGLAYNTSVKITDIQGNIMFETESEGGRAVWNGLKTDGGKPSTGVYLVFVTTPDGSADGVKKLTFIK
ncbi:MAG: hypothetical protein K1X54_03380 [Flavobacteriales bacterium]|nr:hypothetical protein [Flavobacteriales bacterium]